MTDQDDLVDPGAFQSLELRIALTNDTSHTEIPSGSPDNPAIRLVELRDRGLVLDTPPHSCARGHNLSITIEILQPAPARRRLEMTAKVELVEDRRVEAALLQYDEAGWDALGRAFSNRQAEIENFLRASRGY